MSFELGSSRQIKVLVINSDGSVTDHRGFSIAFHKDKAHSIVLAATSDEGFVWGRLYLCGETVSGHHPYVIRAVDRVPNSEEWTLLEAAVQDKVGWQEPEDT